MKAIVFTKESILRLNRFGISDEWFAEFSLPRGGHGLKRAVIEGVCYIIEEDLASDLAPLVVCVLEGENAVFREGLPNAMTLDRVLTASASHFFSTAQIPSTWKPYSEDNILSFYAGNIHRGKGARLHVQKNPNGSSDLFVFARTEKTVGFDSIDKTFKYYSLARSNLVDAILSSSNEESAENTAGIVLCERLPQGFVQGADLKQWYDTKLTGEQRKFVNMPYSGPVRLRGAAGTGKTISLVVKMLRDALQFRDAGIDKRLCFVAHSQGSIDLVMAISESLVAPVELRSLADSSCKLEFRTLYDLANEHLRFQLRDLRPVSLDGIEGRKWQFETIDASLKDAWTSPVLQARYRGVNQELFEDWRGVGEDRSHRLTIDLMNEFASVIDAEYIRRGEESGDKYVNRSSRPAWLMKLPSEIDRRFVLEIHSIYKKYLLEMNALSIDEMIADFNAFLDSNAWERERKWSGYDALFVDELHLFTSLEKQSLQKIVRRKVNSEGVPDRPSIFMAYDLKQSPRDSFVDYFALDGSVFSPRSGLQNSDLVQLSKVFRYTPQIAEFLRDVDAAFPAIDVPGEWDAYVGDAELPDSDTPQLLSFSTDVQLLDEVFAQAGRVAKRIEGGGRRVAVLCVSEEVFNLYLPPAEGRYSSNCFVVGSREATAELRHVGKRFIFSMPEYVAGLQFDTVFLIHVNQAEAPATAGIGKRRQLISNTYLGASRAEKKLIVCCCETRGGASDILSMALDRGSLVE